MNALDQGVKDGRSYTSRFTIEKMTWNGYRVMGRTTALQRYKQPKAREDYLKGWLANAYHFQSIFKPEDQDTVVALAKIDVTQKLLEARREDMEKMLDWREDDPRLQHHLHGAYDAIEIAQAHLSDLMEALRERES